MWVEKITEKKISDDEDEEKNKCIELIFEIAENKGDYPIFYEALSKNFKLSIHEGSVVWVIYMIM